MLPADHHGTEPRPRPRLLRGGSRARTAERRGIPVIDFRQRDHNHHRVERSAREEAKAYGSAACPSIPTAEAMKPRATLRYIGRSHSNLARYYFSLYQLGCFSCSSWIGSTVFTWCSFGRVTDVEVMVDCDTYLSPELVRITVPGAKLRQWGVRSKAHRDPSAPTRRRNGRRVVIRSIADLAQRIPLRYRYYADHSEESPIFEVRCPSCGRRQLIWVRKPPETYDAEFASIGTDQLVNRGPIDYPDLLPAVDGRPLDWRYPSS